MVRPNVMQQKAAMVLAVLEELYPDARCALYFRNPFELLIATILSAQCTDVRVNQVTPGLFTRYPSPRAFAEVDLGDLEDAIRSTGFFRNKAKHIIGCAAALIARHGGLVPQTMEELIALPGVGRKTANVVLGNIFDIPAMVVDTHVKRLANRFGWTHSGDPFRIERDLCQLLPMETWTRAGHLLILHGRARCKALTPLCLNCPISDICPRCGVIRSK
jgi:endonuclease III